MSHRPPRDERSVLNLPKPEHTPPVVHERETLRSDGTSGQLEAIGKSLEGLDGKRYLGSFAVHVFEIKKLTHNEYVYAFHSTDITKIPETVAATSLPELGRAVMQRYGRKPPRKTTDKNIHVTERKV